MKNICAIFNIPPFYRNAIYLLMDQHLDADFYFGDYSIENISMMNPKSLKGFRYYLRNIYRGDKLIWQKGAVRAAFSSGGYSTYILTGNPGIKSNWIILFIARILGRKVWLWSHGLRGNESGKSRLVNILYMKMASGLLLYNERAAEMAKKVGIPAKSIHVIYNSLDYANQKLLRNKVGDISFIRNYFGNDLPYVLFMGRLTASKKVDMMLKAMKNADFNIVIVGDGPQRHELELLSEELSLENRVWFYGECYDEQMNAQLIYHSSVLVSPGNIGLSAIHSMTYGTVAVTHNDYSLQMPEVEAVYELSQKLGINLLFDYGDESSLYETVSRAMAFVSGNRDVVREKCYSVIEEKWNAEKQIQIMKTLFGM